jgi:hypothetical protein
MLLTGIYVLGDVLMSDALSVSEHCIIFICLGSHSPDCGGTSFGMCPKRAFASVSREEMLLKVWG